MPTAPCQHISRLTDSTIALIKVCDDLLKATENGQMSALCLLDLTAAFDTVDHELLLARLERTFGMRGRVLAWFKSYITGPTYCVIYAGASSSIMLRFTWIRPRSAIIFNVHGRSCRLGNQAWCDVICFR